MRHEAITTQAYDKAADAAKQGANEARMAGHEMKDKAASTAEDVRQLTNNLIFLCFPF